MASQRDGLEKSYRDNLERRLSTLEKQLENDPDNPEILGQMGLMALLEDQWERAGALLDRAHGFAPDDMAIAVNLAITKARRGQLQAALTLLEATRAKHPNAPLVLMNLALVALQARRPQLVHESVRALEQLWLQNAAIAQEFHDEAVSARGLAFVLEGKFADASVQLDAAARHAVQIEKAPNLEAHAQNESGEFQLEGKEADAELLANLALAEAEAGQVDTAIGRLKAALRMAPGHPRILNNLGVLAYRQGRIAQAHRYIDLARAMEEELGRVDPVTWNHMGVVLSAMGQLDRAMEAFGHAGNLEHAEVEVYYNLGRAFIQFGKADVGVNYLRQAFQIEPNNADVHSVLGAAYVFSGKMNLYGEALKHLKRALQLNSHHKSAALNLILALIEIQNLDAARNLLGQAIKLFPGDAEPFFLAALITLANAPDSGKDTERFLAAAAGQFDGAMARRGDVPTALYNSALCQFSVGFRDQASKLLEGVIARDASIGPAYYLIGFGHAVAKRDAEAIKAWRVAAQLEPDNVDLHVNLGALLYRAGDFNGAARAYANAHRLAPQDPIILAALGVSFAQVKLYNQAITALEQSIAIDPRSPMTHSNIGLAYYLFKQVEKALQHWRTVSQLDSKYAAEREEEQQRSFDDSIIQLRYPVWRERLIRMAPTLPKPHTRLLPATDTRAYRPAILDPAVQELAKARLETQKASRLLAWMTLK